MPRRSHYEKAFETFLRAQRIPYLVINDQVRPAVGRVNIKCFDFIVLPISGRPLLCEVKGKKFPARSGPGRTRYWENWVPMADLKGLSFWSRLFGVLFRPLVVLLYWTQSCDDPKAACSLLSTHVVFEGRVYALVGVPLAGYIEHGKCRSPRWDVVGMKPDDLKRAARPFDLFLK